MSFNYLDLEFNGHRIEVSCVFESSEDTETLPDTDAWFHVKSEESYAPVCTGEETMNVFFFDQDKHLTSSEIGCQGNAYAKEPYRYALSTQLDISPQEIKIV